MAGGHSPCWPVLPGDFLAAIQTAAPTYFSAVPTIYTLLADAARRRQPDTSSVRFAVCGAAPAYLELLAAAEKRFGFRLIEGYGLTEGTCASTVNPLDGTARPGTVGSPCPVSRSDRRRRRRGRCRPASAARSSSGAPT